MYCMSKWASLFFKTMLVHTNKQDFWESCKVLKLTFLCRMLTVLKFYSYVLYDQEG